jgi:hypothetical protein
MTTPHAAPLAAGWGIAEVGAPMAAADLRPWSDGVRVLLVPRGVVVCDLSPLQCADLRAIDSIARLQLAARRAGCELRTRGARHHLADLWRWVGLECAGPLTTPS